jgi:hypothetical protein
MKATDIEFLKTKNTLNPSKRGRYPLESKYKVKQMTITFPNSILAQFEDYMEKHGLNNKSAVFSYAIKQWLSSQKN